MSAKDGRPGTFAESRPALLRFLTLRGASREDAEDILQEVYVRLLAGGIGPVAEPRAYLYRMTNNHFLGSRRTDDRRTRREESWVDVNGGNDGEIDARPSIEAELIAREQLMILQGVLDGLPERTRTIFRRFRIDGEPQRRIADDLTISVSAVEKHLARAYAAISTARLRLDGDHRDLWSLSDGRRRHGT